MANKTIPQLIEIENINENSLTVIDTGTQTYKMRAGKFALSIQDLLDKEKWFFDAILRYGTIEPRDFIFKEPYLMKLEESFPSNFSAISGGNGFVLTQVMGNNMKFLQFKNDEFKEITPFPSRSMSYASSSDKDDLFVLAEAGISFFIFKQENGEFRETFSFGGLGTNPFISPSGKIIARGGGANEVVFYDVVNNEAVFKQTLSNPNLNNVAILKWSSNSRYVSTGDLFSGTGDQSVIDTESMDIFTFENISNLSNVNKDENIILLKKETLGFSCELRNKSSDFINILDEISFGNSYEAPTGQVFLTDNGQSIVTCINGMSGDSETFLISIVNNELQIESLFIGNRLAVELSSNGRFIVRTENVATTSILKTSHNENYIGRSPIITGVIGG